MLRNGSPPGGSGHDSQPPLTHPTSVLPSADLHDSGPWLTPEAGERRERRARPGPGRLGHTVADQVFPPKGQRVSGSCAGRILPGMVGTQSDGYTALPEQMIYFHPDGNQAHGPRRNSAPLLPLRCPAGA